MADDEGAAAFGSNPTLEVTEALESENATPCRLLGVGLTRGLAEVVLVFSDAEGMVWTARSLPGSLTTHGRPEAGS